MLRSRSQPETRQNLQKQVKALLMKGHEEREKVEQEEVAMRFLREMFQEDCTDSDAKQHEVEIEVAKKERDKRPAMTEKR